MNILRSIFFIALVITIYACGEKTKAPAANNRQTGPLVVDGFLVSAEILTDNIEVPGTLLPAEETQLRSEVSGRIVQLNINEGTNVQRGALLVKQFDDDLQAQLNKLQVQLKIAIKSEERQKELLAINGISQQEYDLTSLQVDNLNADIEAIKIAISKTEIRAPYAGKIGLRNVSLGAYLSTNDVVATIRQTNQLKLEFSVPEKYARSIDKGYKVKFMVDGGLQEHTGVVIATESGVDQATRTLRVRALVNGNNPELVPGVFAKVKLQMGSVTKGLLVPSQSVIPQARNKQVILLRGDSAAFTIVETGLRDSAYVEIVRGLKAGDTVITTGLMAIRPNGKVKVGKLNKYQ
ncbi:MAG: efflux RND transporter periplasmic adaptor subunit [Cyclobacteriaceae bacterium]|nr:efflux RND transporter periplasmic adaptor subunit [Cyclobacteriaceae bacterium]